MDLGEVATPESAAVTLRITTRVSPWVTLVGKDVQFPHEPSAQTYHCLSQAAYVSVLACTPTGRYALVRQFRPAVQEYTWELPAGLVERDETADLACRRELEEEVGVSVHELAYLGETFPDTGRLENRMHVYFARVSEPSPAFQTEPGLVPRFVTREELHAMICTHQFKHQLHLGVLTMAALRGLVQLGAPGAP